MNTRGGEQDLRGGMTPLGSRRCVPPAFGQGKKGAANIRITPRCGQRVLGRCFDLSAVNRGYQGTVPGSTWLISEPQRCRQASGVLQVLSATQS